MRRHWWIFLIAGIGFVIAYQFVEPAPPKRIVITTGSDSGAYYHFCPALRDHSRPRWGDAGGPLVGGPLQNLERLKADEACRFGSGRVIEPKSDPDEVDDSGLLSLGSLFYEPVWVFYRGEQPLTRPDRSRGKRIAIGAEGSGVRQLARQLLEVNEVPVSDRLLPLSGLVAAEELQQGRIDAAFVIASESAGGAGAAAFARVMRDELRPGRRLPALSFSLSAGFPHGVADLVRAALGTSKLLALTANLIICRRRRTWPCRLCCCRQSEGMHGKSGFFQDVGEFPSYKRIRMLPLSPMRRAISSPERLPAALSALLAGGPDRPG